MSDFYFFKKINQGQWLALRIPAGLHIDVGDDGKLKVAAPWSYEALSPLPAWAQAARLLVLQKVDDVVAPALVRSGDPQLDGWQPFQQSRAVLAGVDGAAGLQDAMQQAVANPLLPLRVYQAYRDFPTQPNADAASPEQLCAALILALGGSASDQPVEAFSELLFFVDADDGPDEASVYIDDGAGAGGIPTALEVTAQQTASGVSLQLTHGGRRITNAGVFGLINQRSGIDSPFAPFYRWRRTLGIAERPSADSGAMLLPGVDQALRAGALDGVAWAERPLRLADRIGAGQLAGELLNYEVRLFNPHGRCTHSGRVLLKRQRLDPPAAPLRATAQLLPTGDGGLAHCVLSFALAAGEAQYGTLDAVVYRQDYPVVPSGFYGDDDDGALTVARSLGDAGGEQFNSAFTVDAQAGFDGAEALPNLSNHNLTELAVIEPETIAGAGQGQPDLKVAFNMPLSAGSATRLFLALRRRVEGAAAPESPVALVQHLTGLADDSVRAVPHFERFWDPLPARAWLGEGAARVMELPDDAARPATVRVVIDHAVQAQQPGDGLVGGYRLWMRDLAAPGDSEPFHAVALLQAVPRLVKLYAPIESGRRWAAVKDPAGAVDGPPAPLPAPEFILLSQPAPVDVAASLDGNAVLALARKLAAAGDDAAQVLGAIAALRGAGAAREVVLSVAKRRAIEQGDDLPPGNWVFFHDQPGNLLGRAIQFWFPADPTMQPDQRPAAVYHLVETPNSQDTAALDDFGRVAWCWQGLADLWRHELEWMIEAVPRYAPINGKRAALGVDGAGEVRAVRDARPALSHWLVVARREPFQARFGLSQVLDADDDAFVIALHAPQEFRHALHNSVARTRQGVLRMQPARASTSFLFADNYVGADETLLMAWLNGAAADATPRPPRMTWKLAGAAPANTYAELVYDEPPCMALSTAVGASADAMQSANPPAIGPLRRPRMPTRISAADAPRLNVAKTLNQIEIGIPMARLDWWYSGASRPAVKDFMSAPAFANHRESSLLRLPDPEAELLLYFQFRDKPLRQVAHFRGSAFADTEPWDIPEGAETVAGLAWGAMRIWLGLQASLAPTGELRIVMVSDTTLPELVVARWRCQGQSFPALAYP